MGRRLLRGPLRRAWRARGSPRTPRRAGLAGRCQHVLVPAVRAAPGRDLPPAHRLALLQRGRRGRGLGRLVIGGVRLPGVSCARQSGAALWFAHGHFSAWSALRLSAVRLQQLLCAGTEVFQVQGAGDVACWVQVCAARAHEPSAGTCVFVGAHLLIGPHHEHMPLLASANTALLQFWTTLFESHVSRQSMSPYMSCNECVRVLPRREQVNARQREGSCFL